MSKCKHQEIFICMVKLFLGYWNLRLIVESRLLKKLTNSREAFVGAGLAPALTAYEMVEYNWGRSQNTTCMRCSRAGASPTPRAPLL